MWISIIQICIVVYVWILGKEGIGEAALLNLVLTVRIIIIQPNLKLNVINWTPVFDNLN